MRAWLVLLAAMLVATGCGGEAAKKQAAVLSCKEVASEYRICGLPSGEQTVDRRSRIDKREGGSWREIAGPPVRPVDGRWIGHWRSLHVSPDGRTLLATWSAECEIPVAYLLSVEGGKLRPVAGKLESVGLGWSRDGQARVKLPGAGCGHRTSKPGIYLVDPETRVRKLEEGPLKGPMPLQGGQS